METYKLLIIASRHFAQFDLILHMLPVLFREYQTGCTGVVQSGRSFSKFVGIVADVESAEQAAPVMCSLIRVFF